MLILNILTLIWCVAALKARDVGIEKRQAAAMKQYPVYTIDQPVCSLHFLKKVSRELIMVD